MADVQYTRPKGSFLAVDRVVLYEWTLDAATSPNAVYANVAKWPDITVQHMEVISGTPTVTFQGTLTTEEETPAVPFALTDQAQAAISLTTAGDARWVLESPWMARPQVAGGEARVRIIGHIGGSAGH